MKLWHIVSALKNLLTITVGAILGFKIVNQTYDIQAMGYFLLGLIGFTLLSILEEKIKHDN